MNIIKIFIFVLTLSACTTVPKSELQNLPSLIEIIGIDFEQASINVRISHRNQTARKNSQLSCKLLIKDQSPVEFGPVQVPDLSNYATETLTINLKTEELPAIDNEHNKLMYVLDCFIFSENFRTEHVIKKSSLYRVPGSQSEFR